MLEGWGKFKTLFRGVDFQKRRSINKRAIKRLSAGQTADYF
jgi:hypothetical protein